MDRACIFITGAGRGIGSATARLFAERGWFVGASDLEEEGLLELEKEFGSERVWTGRLDVTELAEFERSLESFGAATNGRLDLLHNNAGILFGGALDTLDPSTDAKILNVNVLGVLNGSRAGLPLLRQTPNSLLFSTASSGAIRGVSGLAVYCATKAAVRSLTESLSEELAASGVRVGDVLPGIIDTEMIRIPVFGAKDQKVPLIDKAIGKGAFRLAQPAEVAEVVWRAYASQDPRQLHWYIPEELESYATKVGSQPRGFNPET